MQDDSKVELGTKLNTATRLIGEAIGMIVSEGVPEPSEFRQGIREQFAQIEEAARASKGAIEAQEALEQQAEGEEPEPILLPRYDGTLLNEYGPQLLGLVVSELYVTDKEHMLALVTNRSETPVLVLDTEGDCCSESWWADAIGVKQLLGHRVTGAVQIDLPEPDDDRGRQDEDRAYGVRIHTEGGECDLVFRNSSNGYYGRWCKPGWCKPRWAESLPDSARKIEEDWRA